MMKKFFLAIIVLITVTALISSCSPSRKTGCPTVFQQVNSEVVPATI